MNKDKKVVVSPSLKPLIVTHRCCEWRLNVYRKWKANNPGKT